MPKNPEREGSPRLITITEIAEEYGVSRATVHNYRRSGTFPRPAPVEGTEKTKLRFRADEVAAWFEANPKQQGRRTDLAPTEQGESMSQATEKTSPTAATKPDYLTGEQWAGFVFAILGGTVQGIREAGLNPGWGTEVAAAAVKGARARLDELMAESSDG